MIAPFAEGLRSIAQPCSLLVVVPIVLVVVAARARPQVVVAAVAGAVVGGSVFAAGWIAFDDQALRVSAAVVLAGVGAIVIGPRLIPVDVVADPRLHATITASLAFVTTLWWRPCVVAELGQILTGARRDPWAELLPMSAYMVGLLMPVVVAGLVVAAIPRRPALHERISWIAAAAVSVIALSVLAGQHRAVSSTLVRWTTT
jgi:cytochrome c biogenesis protein CcdA